MIPDNRRVVLRHPVAGAPTADDFTVTTAPVRAPQIGEFVVRHRYIALDPWQRSAIAGRHSAGQEPLGAGAMPPAEVIGEVIASRHNSFSEGMQVRLAGGWQEYSLSDGAGVTAVDAAGVPLSAYLGVLGMPGLTAWASVMRLADVQPEQVVLVSAALGPVGSMVGQLAQYRGARAVGIAGGESKCERVVTELGFSQCVDYRANDYPAALRAAVGTGADVYHDNVGGQMLIDACAVLKDYATVVLCGLISQYNDPAQAVNLPVAIPIMKRLVMKGLVVYDHADAEAEFLATVRPLVRDGSIRYLEDRAMGIEASGAHFARLMAGRNLGKTLVVL
ncbi:MAG: NADP-dependent oxidoreductase [Gammaproteobacteria bacterium]|nr:NADP-dependent oxidoreductase [Gammaproteobacteria bacterium]